MSIICKKLFSFGGGKKSLTKSVAVLIHKKALNFLDFLCPTSKLKGTQYQSDFEPASTYSQALACYYCNIT